MILFEVRVAPLTVSTSGLLFSTILAGTFSCASVVKLDSWASRISILLILPSVIVTPTVKGEAIYDVVNQAMPDILNPKLTASWEKGLDMVAKREIEPQIFMDKLENYINSKFDKLVVKI